MREACLLDSRRAWCALRIRPRYAARIREALDAAGIETFYPTSIESRQWSDRTVQRETPWFPGYLFARFSAPAAGAILSTPGVLQILKTSDHAPAAIPDAEIADLRKVANAPVTPAPCPYVAGVAVTVESGPLAGVTGVVERTRGAARLFVRCELLNRSVAIEVDAAQVRKAAA